MNKSGKIVPDEDSAVGCKVEANLVQPNLALVMDKVGFYLSQEVGGELFLTRKDDKAYKPISTKHKHLKVIGVISLDWNPALCVVIITGKKGEISTATSID